jgi:DHA1 family bicyclomycin/chloramphenicol resistance-like MFS transporter
MVPLFVFMTACGFTFPCVQVLALDRHGKAAGTAASILGATNFGVAGLISPIVGWVARDAGITATTMASVMVGARSSGRSRSGRSCDRGPWSGSRPEPPASGTMGR